MTARGSRRRWVAVLVAVIAVGVWIGYPLVVPLINPIARPFAARQVFRTVRVADGLRLLRTAMSGELGTDGWAELDSDFHRDHTLAEACEASRRWTEARIDHARGVAQAVMSGSEPPAEEVVAAARVLVANQNVNEARALLERRVHAEMLLESDDLGPVPDELLAALAEVELRDAEVTRCRGSASGDECLFQPSGDDVGQRGTAARTPGLFGVLAARHPDDPSLRWRAALAAREAGSPLDMPVAPSARWTSAQVSLPPFPEISTALGLRVSRAAGGMVLDDFDGDGDLDLVVLSHLPCDPVEYLRNRGDGTFEDATVESGLGDQLGGFGAAQGDVDGDGYLDLVIVRSGWAGPGRSSLLMNDGRGRFTDVTRKAGLDASNDATAAVALADYDGDGRIDLFLADIDLGHAPGSRSRLYRNAGGGRFEETTFTAGLPAIRFATGAAWGDYDDDGRPDLYVSTILGPNLLYHNDGSGRFSDATVKAGVLAPLMSGATWFFDYDNDGHLDLWASSYWAVPQDEIAGLVDGRHADPATTLRLYRNRGDGTFEDRTVAAGLDVALSAMGGNFGDLDGDGWLDVYIGTGAPALSHLVPNRLFRNVDGIRFEDATFDARVGHLQKGSSVVFGDVDDDGAVDLIANQGGASALDRFGPVLFHNPLAGLHVTELDLRGARSNASAIGTRLTAWLSDGRRLDRMVSSGSSFGASPLRQSLGLGGATGIERLEVRWPSGLRETLAGLAAGKRYRIVEGEGRAQEAG